MAAAPPRVLDTRTVISCWWDTGGNGHRRVMAKHGVGVEPLFIGIFGATVLGVPDVTWSLKTFYNTLPPNDVCFDVILSHS